MNEALVGEADPHPSAAPGIEALRIGLLGCGVVGSSVAKALLEEGQALARAARVPLELARIAVRHPDKKRSVVLPPDLITTDALAVAIDPGIDIVIEVIGGIDVAFHAIKAALADNKAVVTANKQLLAGPGAHLIDDSKSQLRFEASVCAAIPVIRTIKDSCAGDRVESFTGIFSGTCNFVLCKMLESGISFEQALADAVRLGYAEADPSADVDGWDAAAKVSILARVAFGMPTTIDDVWRKGISGIDRARITEARSQGHVFKLIGGARRVGNELDLLAKPMLVSQSHPLAAVDGVQNAVIIETARAGRIALQGVGAGGDPTASAVLGDLVAVARERLRSNQISPPCFAKGS